METGGRSENISLVHTKSLLQGLLEVYLDVCLLSTQTTDCNKERKRSIGTGIENHAVKTLSHSFWCGAPRRAPSLKSSRNDKRSVCPQTSNCSIRQSGLNKIYRIRPLLNFPYFLFCYEDKKKLDLSIQILLWFLHEMPVQTHHATHLTADCCVCDKKSNQQKCMDYEPSLCWNPVRTVNQSDTFKAFLTDHGIYFKNKDVSQPGCSVWANYSFEVW